MTQLPEFEGIVLTLFGCQGGRQQFKITDARGGEKQR